jgi:hypothetical protein
VLPENHTSSAAHLPDGLRRRLAMVTRGQWAFAMLFLFLLMAVPVGLTLARAERFDSRIQVFESIEGPEARAFQTSSDLESYVSTLAMTARVTKTAERLVDFPLDRSTVADNTRVAPGDSSTNVFLITSGTTPKRAEQLANVVGRLVVDESRHDSEARIRSRLQRLLGRAAEPDLSHKDRTSIPRRIEEVVAKLRDPRPPITLREKRASTPAVTATIDKLVQRLPGDFPPSPSPAWAGLAGLLLAVALLAVWLLVPARESQISALRAPPKLETTVDGEPERSGPEWPRGAPSRERRQGTQR